MTRVIRCALVLLLIVAGGVAGTASPSWARCYSSTCTGQDPVVQGCGADASTIDTIWVGYQVNLRYSDACHAAWAQAKGTASSRYAASIEGYASRTSTTPLVIHHTGTPSPEGSYSLMIGYTYWVQACQIYLASGWSTQGCTGRH
ncbi:DUF2690 domain-containing protein [Micromonospora sp. RP3T]|uniref:DUF2690 domain-containing protein n=1 Tax=Micromonospora sp. RP3T TaxID=2135446 RepID=UPI000D170FE9|nr:DUF2690 domain-containing protein [Micromonospora sp. RP3T]PTA42906.1 hypothetical protein C8054_28190 [Micromonospora sp. RP3T]